MSHLRKIIEEYLIEEGWYIDPLEEEDMKVAKLYADLFWTRPAWDKYWKPLSGQPYRRHLTFEKAIIEQIKYENGERPLTGWPW